jgi:hypothetical protein
MVVLPDKSQKCVKNYIMAVSAPPSMMIGSDDIFGNETKMWGSIAVRDHVLRNKSSEVGELPHTRSVPHRPEGGPEAVTLCPMLITILQNLYSGFRGSKSPSVSPALSVRFS